MNDFSDFDGDAERLICDLRVKGKTEVEVCSMLGVTLPDIHRALDEAAQASMTPAARVRGIYLDAARLERIQQVFIPLVESADDKAAMVIIRAQERKATLMGDNAPLRVDPIQLAETARPKPNSTQAMLEVLERLQAEDKQALRNGGPGYGDWRDDRDREEMAEEAARREREKADE
ncbi:MAG TPA: hypothetical protein VGG77_11565 [Roseiarcus sp.]